MSEQVDPEALRKKTYHPEQEMNIVGGLHPEELIRMSIREEIAEAMYYRHVTSGFKWENENQWYKDIYLKDADIALSKVIEEIEKMELLSDEEIEHIVEHAFDSEVILDHKPTQWELELYVYKKVLEAQLKAILSKLQEGSDG